MIKLKCVYFDVEEEDGFWIFVDRFWLWGFLKEKVYLDLWLKEIVFSNEVCKVFDYVLECFVLFVKKY